MTEKARREEYLKTKISEGFSLFYDKKKNFIEKKEVPYVMRYLGQFPSEAQEQEFEPDEPETVLAAFRLLDPENKGYIEIEEMKRHLETSGI
ncbi:uncharacterized protein LOC116245613 [Nymphaea colorata]|uniref:uncharacterized protein LOC116245613 n=1 Tax=Nymphaea colorata TaxID=210225 RepID=UPI00129E9F90|nr:uncharacterized protein LOC116245613 [Nymphaea colorata]